MFFSTLSLAVLAATGALITASPVPRSACGTSTYGPFKLFAQQQQGSDEAQIVRVVKMSVDSNNNTISTMTVCETCGDAPGYWQLKGSVLTPYFFDNAEGQSTINMPLEQGKVNFVTGDESSLTKFNTYCAVRDSSAGTGLPGFLAVNGDADSFSVCSFVGTRGPTHRRDVYFKQAPNRLTYGCQPVHLVMQSTGFVPEPIPAN